MTRSFHLTSGRLVITLLIAVGLVAANALTVAAASGPYLVKDINASGDSMPSELTALGGKVYFSAKGGGKGRELWSSDGTSAGTVRVRDIRPGTAGASPWNMAAINGLLYFSADDGIHGRELWVSDGTGLGTRLVKDINPNGDSTPFHFTEFNGLVYFPADDGTSGRELWRTDGTNAGTRRVKDIEPGAGDSSPTSLVALPDKLVFARQQCPTPACFSTLYRTDGTSAGTKPLRDVNGDLVSGQISWAVAAGPRMFFSFDETELWRSNGTSAKTRTLGDIPAWEIVAVDDQVFFEVGCCGSGELWKSGGSVASTIMVKAFPENGAPYNLVNLDGTLFFFSNREPWTSDGTTAGTQPVGKQVQAESNFAVLDSVVYFGGRSDDPAKASAESSSPNFVPAPTVTLWRSDGTADGTFSVASTPDAHINNVIAVGAGIFFTADEGPEGTELWRYVP